MTSMQSGVLLSSLLASAVLLCGAPAGAAPAGSPGLASASAPASFRGVVQSVQGGRATVRLDDGRIQGFSVTPGKVQAGQRIQATPVRSGDAMRLDQIQVLPVSR